MAALLSPSHIALIAQGVSAIVASRNADLLPSIMRAIGTQISPDGQLITVFLRASQSAQLLADIATCGPIAVVFSDPASNRTVQVKSGSARIRPATPGDQAVLRRYRGNRAAAARHLGMSRTTLWRRLKQISDEVDEAQQ